jgi:hypothetical protein
VNTRRIQKKHPKKSWTSKKIQTHEFVGKNNKKTAYGSLISLCYISPIKISEIRILGQRTENELRKKIKMGLKK